LPLVRGPQVDVVRAQPVVVAGQEQPEASLDVGADAGVRSGRRDNEADPDGQPGDLDPVIGAGPAGRGQAAGHAGGRERPEHSQELATVECRVTTGHVRLLTKGWKRPGYPTGVAGGTVLQPSR